MAVFEPIECPHCGTLIEQEADFVEDDFCAHCFSEDEEPYTEPEDEDDRIAREDQDEANHDRILKLWENGE
jgi:hypothetical protein